MNPIVVQQQPTTATATGTTTTHALRSNYKPIAPAPPQQNQASSNLIAVQQGENKTDTQQILTIPVGSTVYMPGGAGIRPGMPIGSIHSIGDVTQHNQQNGSGCFITNSAVTNVGRMPAPGLITVGPAPLSAMANMAQTVPASSTQTVSTSAPRMAIPPLQPVTLTVSSSPAPQLVLPSPAQSSVPLLAPADKVEGQKESTSDSALSPKKEAPLTNGTIHPSDGDAPRDRKDPSLPQAVVRPQILTHVLGDFVIQESSEPFPVGRFHTNEPICNGHTKLENGGKHDDEPPSMFSVFIFWITLYLLPLCYREKVTHGTANSVAKGADSSTDTEFRAKRQGRECDQV